jgi:Holliday junction resolvase RusA-like endonuclease
MTMTINFTIPGVPVAKGRARFAKRGAFVHSYTPEKTRTYEDHVREVAVAAMGSGEPLETPLKAYIYIKLPVPKAFSKKKTAEALVGLIRPAKKPDIDNYIKSVMDGLNGVCYVDDCQIVDLHSTKVYSTDPGVDVLIMESLI